MTDFSEQISQKTLLASETFRTFFELFSLLSNIILYFLIIRSFLYVFSRVTVSTKYQLPATLEGKNKISNKAHIKKRGQEYVISSTENQKFYVVRTLEPSGRAPKISLPQSLKSIVARIFGKAYTMNEIQMEKGRSPVQFTSTGSSEFIEWELQENEEIIFSYKNFIAMTENIRLRTVISFRLTALIFGGVFHSCAQGPGKVIFSTRGKAKCFEDGTQAGSVPINRIIAWQRNAKFDVESELNHFDIFLSGVYLKPASADAIIIDADKRNAPNTGLVTFIKKFLLPV